ncbi:uncharacterized protein TNCV_3031311 [Trichonephila clavipes]|nr:uncharacterized protein TNCV_3031311 [Trichonephila clavipes]
MDEEANFPIAASVLRNNLYMDDVLCGDATLEEAIVLRQQLKGILNSAGIELHKLCANHEKLSPDPEQNYNFATLTETKTLGVSWKPNLDCFLIKVKVSLDSSYTKRDVLSTIAKIQLLYPNQLWRHVPSDQNPADLVSRGVDPDKLLQQNLWFNGPTFLSGDDYPNRTINCREKLDEYNSELKNCVNEQIENFQSVLNIHVNDF